MYGDTAFGNSYDNVRSDGVAVNTRDYQLGGGHQSIGSTTTSLQSSTTTSDKHPLTLVNNKILCVYSYRIGDWCWWMLDPALLPAPDLITGHRTPVTAAVPGSLRHHTQ